jgi:hypothetical protein
MSRDEALKQLADGDKHAVELDTSKLPDGYAGDQFSKDVETVSSRRGKVIAWLYMRNESHKIRILFKVEDGWDEQIDDIAFDGEIKAASFIEIMPQDVELLI